MLLAEAFRSDTTIVKAASSGDMALEMLKKGHPDIIFLDLKMPKKDGTEVLDDLKAAGFTGKIVVITGMDTLGFELGDVDYILHKPFDIAEAVGVLYSLLGLNLNNINMCS